MFVSTFNVLRDNNEMSITHNTNNKMDSKPQGVDFVGNVEVIMTNDPDQKNNYCTKRNEGDTNKKLKTDHNDAILTEDEKASNILRFIELMNSKKSSIHKNDARIEKSLQEKCYDTHASMKELDVCMGQESYETRTFSSAGKQHSDIDLVENMRFICDIKNSSRSKEKNPTAEVRISNLDISTDYTTQNEEKYGRKQGPTRVTFHKDVVTNVAFFHPVSKEDRKTFFYTSDETRQFRTEYIWELRNGNRTEESIRLDEKGVEVWDAIQYYGENVLRYLFPIPK